MVIPLFFILTAAAAGYASTAGYPEDTLGIHGGQPVEITSVPFMAYYFSTESLWCGASIVHTQFLVTAAHCQQLPESSSTAKVIVGKDRITKREIYNERGHEIEKLIPHQYNRYTHENDIMLIKLKYKLTFSASVNAIRMVDSNFRMRDWSTVQVYGFGATETQPQSEILLGVSLPVMPFQQCKRVFPDIDTNKMICAGGHRGQTSCSGDSGGPLVYNNYLIGVVSFGAVPCGHQGYPGVFTSISYYRTFIDEAIRRNQ